MPRKLSLQNFLPYLLNRSGLRIGLLFSRDIEQYGLTLPMWRVMTELWFHGNNRLGELSERTSIDISTLSRLLIGMQRKKLIIRRRSGIDGRALSLTLTERGIELAEKITPLALRYEEIASHDLSDLEVKQLKVLLKKVYANLESHDLRSHQGKEMRRPRAKKRAAKRKN